MLTPHYVEKIWGGELLYKIKGLGKGQLPLGESWEVSRLTQGPSCVGPRGLDEILSEADLPYLVKFIDTSDNLSVQVHPDDEYAKKNENSKGKSECWLILDALPSAGIYLGFKEGVDKAEFEKAVLSGNDITKFLKFVPVSRGNFFYVPAGTVHAIGKGVLLAEVQQSSGITYRVWDWNRVDSDGKGRTLHIKQAMDVLNFDPENNDDVTFKKIENVFDLDNKTLLEHEDFEVHSYCFNKGEELLVENTSKRKRSIICLKGEVSFADYNDLFLKAYQSTILFTNEDVKIAVKEDTQLLVVR